MARRPSRPTLLLFALLASATPARAAEPAAPVTASASVPLSIGDTFTVESKVLGETRRINVYRPASAGRAALADDTPLPVLYMPDGAVESEDFLHIAGLVQIGALNGTMRPFLLVGIENTERTRDLTGPTEDERDMEIEPRGGSAGFRKFLRSELMPLVRARYPTTDETAIVGESLGGLFVVETFLLEPDLFDTYIAVDPSLWWDGERLVDQAAAIVAKHPPEDKTLFLAASTESDIGRETARLVEVLAGLGGGIAGRIEIHHAPMPGETHGTIFHPAALRAFRTVLAPEPPEAPVTPEAGD